MQNMPKTLPLAIEVVAARPYPIVYCYTIATEITAVMDFARHTAPAIVPPTKENIDRKYMPRLELYIEKIRFMENQ